jgi:acyl dehydratase
VILDGLDAVRATVGQDLGTSEWTEVTAEQVRLYCDATGDDADAGDLAGDQVPPLLLLALTNLFLPQIIEVKGVSAGVNYGTAQVRFPAPVPVGSKVRGCAELTDASDVHGGVQTTIRITVEAEGSSEPAVVVDSLSRWLE